jgi:Fic family protein
MAQTDETIAATLKRAQFWELIVIPTLTFVSKNTETAAFDDFFGKLTVSKYAKITKVSTDTALRDIKI